MTAFDVLSVTLPPQPPPELLVADVQEPAANAHGDSFSLPLKGIVLGRDLAVTAVEVLHNGRVIQSAKPELPFGNLARGRPALGERFPDVDPHALAGFETMVGLLGVGVEATFEVLAALEDGGQAHMATIELRREPLRPPFEPRLRPVMLTGPPRTGSTWLMKMMGAHPSVVVYDEYPYETWPAKYWTHALKVLADPGDTVHSVRPLAIDRDPFHAGRNPFHNHRSARLHGLGDWFGRTHVERLASFFMQTIDDWYLTVARLQEVRDPICFAEKQMTRFEVSPPLIWELYPEAREVFLVRDFRDLACSDIAFSTDPRTGQTRGRLAGATRERYVLDDLRPLVLNFLEAWRSRRDRAHLVRYEDLVRSPHETLTAMLDYLGLEGGGDTIDAMLAASPEQASHRTTPDLEASVGRWRDEDDDFRTLIEREFDDLLPEFGYED